MRCHAALLMSLLLLLLLPSPAPAETLDRAWARIYNPSGSESALAMWPAPGGGVDIAADHAGQLVYLQYNQAGTLTAERATGVGISTMPFRVLASDGAGGFVVAALQDSAGKGGLNVLRVSPSGGVTWRDALASPIRYPHAIKIRDDRVYLAIDEDYLSSYDPDLVLVDLNSGAVRCDTFYQPGYSLWTTDIEILDDGRVFFIGHTNSGCDCFTFVRRFDADCNLLDTSPYPGFGRAQFELMLNRNVLIATSSPDVPIADAAFAVTWFNPFTDTYEPPTAHVDSRDLMAGGSGADILEKLGPGLFLAGEHAVGSGGQELILGTVGDSEDLDVDLFRPNPVKSYDALALASAGNHILMLGRETNVSGSSPARIVLLFDANRVLQDTDVEGNLPQPVSMAIGEDGGVYTVGAGGPPGIVLTKLLISGATGVPAAAESKAPSASRLGLPSPNPATSSVRMEYEVAREGETTLEIYDPAGDWSRV